MMIGSVISLQGEITSCSSPQVKTFLQSPGNADSYESLKVTYIPGRAPELHVKNDEGDVLETIDLSEMTTQQIHELVVSKGFQKKGFLTSNEEEL
eukprot:gene7376-10047_t